MVPDGRHSVVRRKDEGGFVVPVEFMEQGLCFLDYVVDNLDICHIFLWQGAH